MSIFHCTDGSEEPCIIIVVDSERQFRYYIVQPQGLRTKVLN